VEEDGEYRLIEIGDGQVSDKKHLATSIITQMLAENTLDAGLSQQDIETNDPSS